MGLISRVLKVTAAGTVASVGVFFGATRNDVFEPMDANDPIFSSPFFQKFNPERNPTLHDLCVRRVPLDKIQPALLEKKGKLVEAFCAGVWGGMGKLGASSCARGISYNSSLPNTYFFFAQDTSPSAPTSPANTKAPRPPVISGSVRTYSPATTRLAP